eukprot:149569_1
MTSFFRLFCFLQPLIIILYGEHNCSSNIFPIDMNGKQCQGLFEANNAHTVQQCINACCVDQHCEVYQFCVNGTCQLNTCWIGRMNNCGKPKKGAIWI